LYIFIDHSVIDALKIVFAEHSKNRFSKLVVENHEILINKFKQTTDNWMKRGDSTDER